MTNFLDIINCLNFNSKNHILETGIFLSIDSANRTGFTRGQEQIPVSETLFFELKLGRTVDNVQKVCHCNKSNVTADLSCRVAI